MPPGMTEAMTPEDRKIQDRARRFVDEELIPWEEHAEMHEGGIPPEAAERHHRLAIELGLYAMNIAKVLSGTKMHVTSFNKASYCFFQAKIAGGSNEGAHAMFFVDKDAPGVRLVRTPRYTHTYADHHAIVAFEDVRVPAANLIGEEGEGLAFTYEWFRYERMMIASRCCGAAERLIDEATAFSKERVQFGRPIIENQAIAHMLADSLTELWAARLMTHRVARNID